MEFRVVPVTRSRSGPAGATSRHWSPRPPTATTAAWFRNTSVGGSFWGEFWPAYMAQARADDATVRPVFIEDYLDQHGRLG